MDNKKYTKTELEKLIAEVTAATEKVVKEEEAQIKSLTGFLTGEAYKPSLDGLMMVREAPKEKEPVPKNPCADYGEPTKAELKHAYEMLTDREVAMHHQVVSEVRAARNKMALSGQPKKDLIAQLQDLVKACETYDFKELAMKSASNGLQVVDRSTTFFSMLGNDTPRAPICSNINCVHMSLTVREHDVDRAIQKLADTADLLHHKYGINGFLANCSVIELIRIDSEPRFAVFSFLQIQKEKDLDGAREYVQSRGIGARDGEVSALTSLSKMLADDEKSQVQEGVLFRKG